MSEEEMKRTKALERCFGKLSFKEISQKDHEK